MQPFYPSPGLSCRSPVSLAGAELGWTLFIDKIFVLKIEFVANMTHRSHTVLLISFSALPHAVLLIIGV
jgi:hypothetical protein